MYIANMIKAKDPVSKGVAKVAQVRKAIAVRAEVPVVPVEAVPGEIGRAGKRGRPAGPPRMMVSLGLPPGLVKRVDGWASARGVTRTTAVRNLLERGLKP